MRSLVLAAGAAALSVFCGPVHADILSEARLGVAAHGLDFNGGDPAVEDGADVSLELLFTSPKPLRYILSPRPYIGGSLNTGGDTDFFSFGLVWQQHVLRDRIFFEADFGLARHNGVLDLPPPGDPARDDIAANNTLFGSRMLFRGALGAGVRITPRWNAQVFYEHLSNAQIFGEGDRNQGLDNVGVRLGYRFGEKGK